MSAVKTWAFCVVRKALDYKFKMRGGMVSWPCAGNTIGKSPKRLILQVNFRVFWRRGHERDTHSNVNSRQHAIRCNQTDFLRCNGPTIQGQHLWPCSECYLPVGRTCNRAPVFVEAWPLPFAAQTFDTSDLPLALPGGGHLSSAPGQVAAGFVGQVID